MGVQGKKEKGRDPLSDGSCGFFVRRLKAVHMCPGRRWIYWNILVKRGVSNGRMSLPGGDAHRKS